MTKLTVDSKSFVEAIQWTTKSFDAKDTKAFLSLVIDEDGMGYLSHLNSTSYLRSRFTVLAAELEGKTEVKFALDGRFVQRLPGALSDGPLELSDSTGSLMAVSKAGKFTIPTFTSKAPPAPAIVKLGEVQDEEYFDALQRLAKLTDPASAGLLPVLATVNAAISVEDSSITLMATDRYALGEIKLPFSPSAAAEELLEGKDALLIPHESAVLIAPSKGAGVADLIFEETGGKFGYEFSDGRIALFSLKEVQPLKYAALKETALEDISNSITLSTKDLQKAIATISTLDWDNDKIVLDIAEDSLVVRDVMGTNRLTVETDSISTDQAYTVQFVRSVITEGFAPIATAKMRVNWVNENKAFVFEAIMDTGEPAENVFVLVVPVVA